MKLRKSFLVMLLVIIPMVTKAQVYVQTVCGGNACYTMSATTLLGLEPWKPRMIIPDIFQFTGIGADACKNISIVQTIVIPNSINNIGDRAFQNDTNLTGIYFKGDAPSIGSNVFAGDTKAVVYYLPGTSGWDDFSSNANISTKLWTPKIQACAMVHNGGTNMFGFNIDWAAGQTVVVEVCTNWLESRWEPIQTNTLPTDSQYFSEPNLQNCAVRCYRIRSP